MTSPRTTKSGKLDKRTGTRSSAQVKGARKSSQSRKKK